MKNNQSKALKIGGVCISFYFFNYVLRNVLSVATPNMIKESFFHNRIYRNAVVCIFYMLRDRSVYKRIYM